MTGQGTYRTATAYAAVLALAAGQHRQVILTVPGHLTVPGEWKHVLLKVRRHARAQGILAHAKRLECRDDDGQLVTDFAVRPGPGRNPEIPAALQLRVCKAYMAGGVTQRQVAARFGIAQTSVRKIVRALDT